MNTYHPIRRRVLLLGMSLLSILLVACSGSEAGQTPAPAEPAGGATRTHEGGAVTVTATWPSTSEASFEVVLDTHSVDLDSVDLTRLAVLRTDQGREVPAESWDAPKGGHHRAGLLRFPATVDGTPLLGPDVRTVTLIIRDVAGVPERILEWTR